MLSTALSLKSRGRLIRNSATDKAENRSPSTSSCLCMKASPSVTSSAPPANAARASRVLTTSVQAGLSWLRFQRQPSQSRIANPGPSYPLNRLLNCLSNSLSRSSEDSSGISTLDGFDQENVVWRPASCFGDIIRPNAGFGKLSRLLSMRSPKPTIPVDRLRSPRTLFATL